MTMWPYARGDFACPSCANDNHDACRVEHCTCECPSDERDAQ